MRFELRKAALCRLVLASAVTLAVAATSDAQKRVVCIDQAKDAQQMPVEDGFLAIHEGYERMRAGQNDVIVRGGTLTDCLAMVMPGDTLVIVAHGLTINGNPGAGFTWCGQTYTGFGPGPGEMPVPPGFNNLQNVTVEFCSCWSANDPDGGGADTSLTDKILEAMGGHPSNTAEGYTGEAEISPSLCYNYPPSIDTQAERDAYDAAINTCVNDDDTWVDKAPVNRSDPPPNPNQQSCVQAVITACVGVTPKPTNVRVKYDNAPVNTGGRSAGRRGTFSCGQTGVVLNGTGLEECPVSPSAAGLLALVLGGAGVLVLGAGRAGGRGSP